MTDHNLERLCKIMIDAGLETGHAHTMEEALDALESELNDVVVQYEEVSEPVRFNCRNCETLARALLIGNVGHA
jgi:hypothetical protein